MTVRTLLVTGSSGLIGSEVVRHFHALGWRVAVCDHRPAWLAGWLAGIERCETPYMAVVPCDSPHFPTDLVQRLADALVRDGAEIAMAATLEDGRVQVQPVFCLLSTMLLESLVAYLHEGGRKIDRWTARHRCVQVVFDDAQAFFNANTLEELQRLQGR